MLHTPLCSLLGISVPVIQEALGGPWSPSARLAAAVSRAGALGSLPTALHSPEQVREDIAVLRDLAEGPYAVNHTMKPFVEEVFAEIVSASPPVVSFALGCRADLVARAHDAGSVFVQQVHSAPQAIEAVEAGADVIIAQGGEAGGFGGACSHGPRPPGGRCSGPSPRCRRRGHRRRQGLGRRAGARGAGCQCRDAVHRLGGGRARRGYREAILTATSDQTVRAAFVNDLVPPASEGAYLTAPRVVRNSFIDEWHGREDDVRAAKAELAERIGTAVADGSVHQLLVITGEVAGAIHEILPAAEIVRRMAVEAEDVLHSISRGSLPSV